MTAAILISVLFGLGMGIMEYNDKGDAKAAALGGLAAGLIMAAALIGAVALGQWLQRVETR